MTKIAVILAGSGVKDGSEIHEATLTLFFLDQLNVNYDCYAPNRNQFHVVNHVNDQDNSDESRNILLESARIARGHIEPIEKLNVNLYDAIIFPGGFGAAKNLFTYAIDGSDFKVHSDVEVVIKSAHDQKKVLGFICIAPVMAAKLLPGIKVTVGKDGPTAQDIKNLGAIHQECQVDDVVWDDDNLIASTPAYMVGPSIKDIGLGIKKLCEIVVNKSKKKVNTLQR